MADLDLLRELHAAILGELTAMIASGETRADRLTDAVTAVLEDHLGDAAGVGRLRVLLAAIEAAAATAGPASDIGSQLTPAERQLWAAVADTAGT